MTSRARAIHFMVLLENLPEIKCKYYVDDEKGTWCRKIFAECEECVAVGCDGIIQKCSVTLLEDYLLI